MLANEETGKVGALLHTERVTIQQGLDVSLGGGSQPGLYHVFVRNYATEECMARLLPSCQHPTALHRSMLMLRFMKNRQELIRNALTKPNEPNGKSHWN